MGNTSVRDVGSLFANLSVGAQNLIANRISNKISTTSTSDSASFQSFLSGGGENTVTNDKGQEVVSKVKNAEKPADDRKDTSDRIAGEGKADAGKTTAVDKKQESVKESSSDDKISANDIEKTGACCEKDVPLTEEETENAAEVLSTLAYDFLLKVSDILQISEEDAKDLLADMNLEITDILEPEKLTAFALRAMGIEDSLSLLTNETHFEQFQSVGEALKELLESPSGVEAPVDVKEALPEKKITDLNPLAAGVVVAKESDEGKELTVGELKELLKNAAVKEKTPEETPEETKTVISTERPADDTVKVKDDFNGDILPKEDSEQTDEGIQVAVKEGKTPIKDKAEVSTEDKDIPDTDVKAAEKAAPVVNVRTVKKEERKEEETVNTAKAEIKTEISTLKAVTTSEGSTLGAYSYLKNSAGRQDGQGKGLGHANPENAGNFQNPLQNIFTQNIQNAAPNVQYQDSLISAQEIANQIMDYMRSQVKPDMQVLEMQLHPASLGNVQVSLIHKDGSVTANFACQNEQVRAVLENQMIQLQERFEEQGIKVNSIEVSVGTHGFEQNLEQQGHQEEQQAANSEAPKRVRRLQLGPDFSADDYDLLEDDDRIAAEMMAANGGTMDVQV